MNRFNLPEIIFFTKDPKEIEREMLQHIKKHTKLTLSEADPRRKMVQALANFVSLEHNKLDHALKQNFLAFATDDALDHRGVDTDTPRLEATSAKTIIEYEFEEGRPYIYTIEEGTLYRVSEDIYFKAIETVHVPVNKNKAIVEAVCTIPGELGNGYLPGDISTLVIPSEYVKQIKNTAESVGGKNVEDDTHYAERIRLSPEKYSVAGPELAYVYWAKTADQEIVDVKVTRLSDATVDVRVLLKDGVLPDTDTLEKVNNTLNGKMVRPLTDKVVVGAPKIKKFNINVDFWISEKYKTAVKEIEARVKEAVDDYVRWQKEKIGRDIDFSELVSRMKFAGASRVRLEKLLHEDIAEDSVAVADNVEINFAGFEDE